MWALFIQTAEPAGSDSAAPHNFYLFRVFADKDSEGTAIFSNTARGMYELRAVRRVLFEPMTRSQEKRMIRNMTTETISKKLFTVDEFCRLSEEGILPPEGRFELIRGEIIEMPRPGPPHIGPVNRLTMLFARKLGDSVIISVQNSLFISNISLPSPDLVLLKPREDYYGKSLPAPDDVFLVVEVSHTSHWYDTKIKAPLYGDAVVPEYWIVNVPKHVLEVRREPADGHYRRVETFVPGQTIHLQRMPDVVFTVDEILGRLTTESL